MIKKHSNSVEIQCPGYCRRIRGYVRVVHRQFLGFALGAASAGYLLLVIEDNRANPAAVLIDTASKGTDVPQKGTQERPKSRELTRQQLDQYVQWAQQINTQNVRGSGFGIMPLMSSLAQGQSQMFGGSHASAQIPILTFP